MNKTELAINTNPVLSRVQEILKNQTAKGIEKYGQTVQPSTLTVNEWIDHASEEVADLLVYLQAFKVKQNEAGPSLHETLNTLYSEVSTNDSTLSLYSAVLKSNNVHSLQRIASIHGIKLGGESNEK